MMQMFPGLKTKHLQKTGVPVMTFKYTEEQLNKLDKELLVQLFLGMQGQLEELTEQTQALNDRMQLMMEQLVLSKKARFGRSSEKCQIRNRSASWK